MTNIEKERKARGFMQIDLANAAGISPQYLCDIERGRTRVSFNTACKIASILYKKKYGLEEVRYLMQQCRI